MRGIKKLVVGWSNWDGKGIDTKKFFVISTNVIGSCFGTTGPMSNNYPSDIPYRLKFPVVTIKDMIKAQKQLLSRLGIYRVKAIVGGSMGGMQALQIWPLITQIFPRKFFALWKILPKTLGHSL